MRSLAKIQINSFLKHIISSKNVKRTFLSSEPLHVFFSLFIYGNQLSHGNPLSVEFHDRRPNCLGKEQSPKNLRNGRMRPTLASLKKIL